MSFGTNSKLSMRQETRQNLVLRLSLSAEKQNGDKGRHYRALLTYWINTFFENQCCRPERFRRYSGIVRYYDLLKYSDLLRLTWRRRNWKVAGNLSSLCRNQAKRLTDCRPEPPYKDEIMSINKSHASSIKRMARIVIKMILAVLLLLYC